MGGKVLDYEAKIIRNEGISIGIEQGIQQGIQAMILDNLEEGFSAEKIIYKLKKRFAIEEDLALAYFERFSKEA